MAFAPTIPQAAAVASSSSSSRPRLPPPVVKRHRAYFTARELAQLSERQRGKLTVKIAEKARQTACLFCEQVGERLGLSVLSPCCPYASDFLAFRHGICVAQHRGPKLTLDLAFGSIL